MEYCKFQVCDARNLLSTNAELNAMTDEELLAEFYSVFFQKNPEKASEFAASLIKATDEDHAWFEQMERLHGAKPEDVKENPEKVKLEEEPEEYDDDFGSM